jgi:hypothetical protein
MDDRDAAAHRRLEAEVPDLPAFTSASSALSSGRYAEMSALLAVTTDLPALSELNTTSLASVVPPITSTIMSMLGSLTTDMTSAVITQPVGTAKSRFLLRLPTAILTIWMSKPSEFVTNSFFLARISTMPPPTVPPPTMPILTVFGAVAIMRTGSMAARKRGPAIIEEDPS